MGKNYIQMRIKHKKYSWCYRVTTGQDKSGAWQLKGIKSNVNNKVVWNQKHFFIL